MASRMEVACFLRECAKELTPIKARLAERIADEIEQDEWDEVKTRQQETPDADPK